MDNKNKTIRPFKRHLIQLYAALLYNAHTKGFLEGEIYTGITKAACVPGLNCYSCPAASFACPLGALQNALASTGNRAPWYILGILLLYGTIFGRTICGWLCPVGFVQDLLHRIPSVKIRKNTFTRVLSKLKYVILVVYVIVLPLWYAVKRLPLPAFCKYICPAGTLEGAVGLLVHPANEGLFGLLNIIFSRKAIILVLLLTGAVFIYRVFCRFVCPLGAIYSLFNRFSLIGMRVDPDACTRCGACTAACRMDVRHVGDTECIQCGECISRCSQKAITLRAGRVVLMGADVPAADEAKETTGGSSAQNTPIFQRYPAARTIIRAAALLLLAGALVFYNYPLLKNYLTPGQESSQTPPEEEPSVTIPAESETAESLPSEGQATEPAKEDEPETVPEESEAPSLPPAPEGHEIGERVPDFTLKTLEGENFTLSDKLGKVVILNLWATWCGPCVKELPYFDRLAGELGDSAAVLAIHSDLITEDVKEYVDSFDYHIPFAIDETGTVIESLGGSTLLPQTIILDKYGIVVYNSVGSVTYEKLAVLAEEAAAHNP